MGHRSVPKKFKDAAEFISRFKLTKWDIKYAPSWELKFIISRGKEEKVNEVENYIIWAGGHVS